MIPGVEMRHLCILGVEVPQCHMLGNCETSSLKSEGKYQVEDDTTKDELQQAKVLGKKYILLIKQLIKSDMLIFQHIPKERKINLYKNNIKPCLKMPKKTMIAMK